MSRRRWDQNTSQVANRLNCAGASYVWLLHVPPWGGQTRRAERGTGGSIFWKTREIGLPSYNDLSMVFSNGGACILFSVVFFPPFPATTTVFGSYLSSLYSELTHYRLPIHMIGEVSFMGATKKTVLIPHCVFLRNFVYSRIPLNALEVTFSDTLRISIKL
jgi:hypothetical protein